MKLSYAWGAVAVIVLASTIGDVLLAHGMKQVGDIHELWKQRGFWAILKRILGTPALFLGVTAMATAFYSLLFGLSWGDVSFVVPASSALTFVANAVAAKIFLHERVDRRRWIAALLVASGVVLLAT